MNKFPYQVGRKLQHIFLYSYNKACSLLRFQQVLIVYLYQFLLSRVDPCFIHFGYHIALSLLGYLSLNLTKPTTFPVGLNELDLFFTTVSVSTISGISVLEMEDFSNTQLIIITILMLLDGEIFISMLGLVFACFKFNLPKQQSSKESGSNPNSKTLEDQIELDVYSISDSDSQNKNNQVITSVQNKNGNIDTQNIDQKHNSIRYLAYVVLGYLIVAHSVDSILVYLYLGIEPSAKEILRNKNLKIDTFSVFTVVSSFANCGLVPTNENMIVLKKNAGLILLLIPQLLLGNTLYPPCLRLVIWGLGKWTKSEEFFYILNNHRDMGYDHVFSSSRCYQLAMTVVGLLVTQLMLFCALELNSQNMEGLNSYQKSVASLFQTVNSRHAGESVFDLSIVSSAMMVLFVVIMYLPPYITFSPMRDDKDNNKNDKKRSNNSKKRIMESLVLSRISYVTIFVILICITERHNLERDPLNFNLLSIMVEVISAYGNVGFPTGYSCKKQLEPDGHCKESWISLAGRFSSKGKVTLILIMCFGKFKKFSRNGGKAWVLF